MEDRLRGRRFPPRRSPARWSTRIASAPSMSTPCQRAYAILARSMPVKIGQCQSSSGWKIRKIKGLACKSLKCISYWNRLGFGS